LWVKLQRSKSQQKGTPDVGESIVNFSGASKLPSVRAQGAGLSTSLRLSKPRTQPEPSSLNKAPASPSPRLSPTPPPKQTSRWTNHHIHSYQLNLSLLFFSSSSTTPSPSSITVSSTVDLLSSLYLDSILSDCRPIRLHAASRPASRYFPHKLARSSRWVPGFRPLAGFLTARLVQNYDTTPKDLPATQPIVVNANRYRPGSFVISIIKHMRHSSARNCTSNSSASL